MTLQEIAIQALNNNPRHHAAAEIAERFNLTRLISGEYVPEEDACYIETGDESGGHARVDDTLTCEECSQTALCSDVRGVYQRQRGRLVVASYCSDCTESEAFCCTTCNELFADDLLEQDEDGDSYCPSCYESAMEDQRENDVPSYHGGFRPYARADRELYSIELEVESPERSELVDTLEHLAARQSPRWLGWEKDGSLDDANGVEILISCLPSMDALKEATLSLLPVLKRHSCTSWDNGRCGLHLNISRAVLRPIELGRLLYLVCKLRPELEAISGRAGQHWCAWPNMESQRMGWSIWGSALESWRKGQLGKYLCIRVGSDRIEWRMFRGSLRASRVALYLRSVEYLMSIVKKPIAPPDAPRLLADCRAFLRNAMAEMLKN